MDDINCTTNILSSYPYGSWLGQNLIGYFQLITELEEFGYQKTTNLTLPTLEAECKYWQYDQSEFQHVTYLKYCDEERYTSYCDVNSDPTAYYDPCSRVEQGVNSVNHTLPNSSLLDTGRFNKLLQTAVYQIPFCGFHVFGLDSEFYDENRPNLYGFLPAKCQAGLVIISLILIILAIVITAMNVIVLIVMLKYSRFF